MVTVEPKNLGSYRHVFRMFSAREHNLFGTVGCFDWKVLVEVWVRSADHPLAVHWPRGESSDIKAY